ncbi:MAG TPA: DivIVA domain-containing protein [Conexibacter sp.]|nr:DivIVA domain-containing protein [Conexibacter sp.]
MSLDRRSIEKRDFPARLRGYDRSAVDAHLRAIADELETRVASPADAAAEQVRAVLSAAEQSAAEIVAQAEADAQRVGSAAGRAGDETTERVTAAASGALERIEALRGELSTLLEALGSRPPAEPTSAAVLPVEPAPAADDAGARLVALELALNGTPREQAEAVLAEQFALADRRVLLDDVYAAAGRA